MVWQTPLQFAHDTSLALIPTPVDRVVVWGLVALVIGLIAWREYTMPAVSPPPLPSLGSADGRKSMPTSDPDRQDLRPGAAPDERSEPGRVG